MSRNLGAVRHEWGDDDSDCNILHVDMDAFFVSVELLRHPDLAHLPVVVAGSTRGVVLAASYPARKCGLGAGMATAIAVRRCPQVVVIPPDLDHYHVVSDEVMRVLGSFTPVVEQVSVDEAFLDVSGARLHNGAPTVIANLVRAKIRSELGLPSSVGIAHTKSVAKIGSQLAKPDGVLLIPQQATQAFLRQLPARALWGVGSQVEKTLHSWGVTTVAQIADLDLPTLQRMVGKAMGIHLRELALGRDSRAVAPSAPEKTISAEHTFAVDVVDPQVLDRALVDLADSCSGRLRQREHLARTVSIKVKTADFRTTTRTVTVAAPTDSSVQVVRVARSLFKQLELHRQPVRLVGVRLGGLVERSGAPLQLTLSQASAAVGDSEIDRVVDGIRRKFGRSAIGTGALIDHKPEVTRASGPSSAR